MSTTLRLVTTEKEEKEKNLFLDTPSNKLRVTLSLPLQYNKTNAIYRLQTVAVPFREEKKKKREKKSRTHNLITWA